jgi:hypothetical protein
VSGNSGGKTFFFFGPANRRQKNQGMIESVSQPPPNLVRLCHHGDHP